MFYGYGCVGTYFELKTQNVTESQGQKNNQWFSYLVHIRTLNTIIKSVCSRISEPFYPMVLSFYHLKSGDSENMSCIVKEII